MSRISTLSPITVPKLPNFQSDEEMAAWFDTHDTADYIDIESLAERRGIPYQRLIPMWLAERFSQEVFDPLPHR